MLEGDFDFATVDSISPLLIYVNKKINSLDKNAIKRLLMHNYFFLINVAFSVGSHTKSFNLFAY